MYKNSIEELIKKRRSIRTYLEKDINKEELKILTNYLKETSSNEIRFEIVKYKFKEGEKFSTYGFIKGAESFIVGIVEKDVITEKKLTLQFGYLFEKIILKATDLGIGTCWIAGTFKVDELLKKIKLKDNEKIVMISPIGYEKKPRLKEKIIRHLAKSDNRKNWEELFFYKNKNTPLNAEETGEYKLLLEMVRLAPSAGNTQPWRIIKNDNRYDFYVAPTRYSNLNNERLNLGYNDLGIAMAHFELMAKEKNINGEFQDLNLENLEDWEYMISWTY